MSDTLVRSEAPETAKTIESRLLGQSVTLTIPADSFTSGDTRWRTKAIYEPFLTARSLPRTGTAIDIGAAYGGFAIPFALAYPGWEIWCFEPDADAFAALVANIEALELKNVVALNVAVSGDIPEADIPSRLATLIAAGLQKADPARIAKACPEMPFRQHREKLGYVESSLGVAPHEDFIDHDYPTLPASALTGLKPTLMKIIAPGCAKGILETLRDSTLDFIVGEI